MAKTAPLITPVDKTLMQASSPGVVSVELHLGDAGVPEHKLLAVAVPNVIVTLQPSRSWYR